MYVASRASYHTEIRQLAPRRRPLGRAEHDGSPERFPYLVNPGWGEPASGHVRCFVCCLGMSSTGTHCVLGRRCATKTSSSRRAVTHALLLWLQRVFDRCFIEGILLAAPRNRSRGAVFLRPAHFAGDMLASKVRDFTSRLRKKPLSGIAVPVLKFAALQLSSCWIRGWQPRRQRSDECSWPIAC